MKNKKTVEKVSSSSQEIRHLGVMIEAVHGDVKMLAEHQIGMQRTLDSHTQMIGSLAENLEIVKSDIEFIKGGLKKKVDLDEFIALVRRVSLLEKRR